MQNEILDSMCGTQVPEEVKKQYDKIADQLKQAISGYVFEPNNDDTWKKIHNAISDQLEKIAGKRTEVKSKTLWSTFSLWQKIAWRPLRMLFKNEIKLYEAVKYYLYEYYLIKDVNGKDDYRNYDVYMSDIDEFEKRFKKWWYEPNPKHILLCTMTIFPVKPAEAIKVNFTMEPK